MKNKIVRMIEANEVHMNSRICVCVASLRNYYLLNHQQILRKYEEIKSRASEAFKVPINGHLCRPPLKSKKKQLRIKCEN